MCVKLWPSHLCHTFVSLWEYCILTETISKVVLCCLGDVHQVYLRWVTCHHGNHRTCKYNNMLTTYTQPLSLPEYSLSSQIHRVWLCHRIKQLLTVCVSFLSHSYGQISLFCTSLLRTSFWYWLKKHLTLILLFAFLFILLLLYWGHTELLYLKELQTTHLHRELFVSALQ